MVRLAICLLTLAAPVSAQAHAVAELLPTPYNLVIDWGQSDLAIVNYPSEARCEAAAKAVNDEVARRLAVLKDKSPLGSLAEIADTKAAFCIPG